MENLLPFLLILVFFGLSFWGEKWLKTWLGFALSCGVMLFLIVMAFVDREHKFPYLLFAIFAAASAWRIGRSSGLMRQLDASNSHH